MLLAPAEDAFGHFAAGLRDVVADVTGSARIDRAAASLAGLGQAVVLRNMRRDPYPAQCRHVIAGIIAYYEMTEWMRQGNLKYASKSGGSWKVETVDSGGNVGEDLSLALNSEGNPRIAYHDHTKGCLKYASKDGGSWTVEAVDCTAVVTGTFASLALDAYGNPRVAYYDLTNGRVKYASAAVELNSPNINWKIGSARKVMWEGTGSADLFISTDDGKTWMPLALGLQHGSYVLQVPNLPTASARLKLERATPHSVSMSGLFTIGDGVPGRRD